MFHTTFVKNKSYKSIIISYYLLFGIHFIHLKQSLYKSLLDAVPSKRLDADISGPANSFLRLNGCTVINRTKDFYPENGIQYTLENGVYLNFINVSQPSPLLNMRDVFGAYDHAFNVVRFKGPERIEELNQLLINENSAVME